VKILILSDRIPPENRGGAGVIAWTLACGLRDAGHTVHVIAATEGQPFEEIRADIPTYHLHSRYPERWHAYFSLYNPGTRHPLKQLYQHIQPDIINAHNIHAHLSYHALTIAHELNIPAVFSSHDAMPFAYGKVSHFIDKTRCDVPPADYRLPAGYNLRTMRFRYNPLRNRRIRHILTRHVQGRTSPSHELAAAHAANDLPPFQTIHNGIDPSRFESTPEQITALRTKLNLNGRKVILFAGRLREAKGMFQMLDALAQLVRTVPEAVLLVLSPLDVQQQVKEPLYQPLLKSHVKAGGWLSGDELAAAYGLADVVAVPSVYLDPFPTVNLEAMAAGKPVITTCYGGSKEAVVDGVTGYVVNPFDTAAFAEQLAQLLTDDGLRERMGTAARQHVMETFPLEKQVAAMVNLFHEILHSA